MDWTMWSTLAEIISSVVILVTLVYVVKEIKQNTLMLQSTARAEVMRNDCVWLYKHIEHSELPERIFSAQTLNPKESAILNAYLLVFMRMKEANYMDYVAGALDEKTWKAYQSSIVIGPLLGKNGRKWWNYMGSRGVFDKDFTDHVDRLLANVQTDDSYYAYEIFQ